MEKNRNKSCTGKSRHIDISYLFDKDRIESNKMSITYYSTEHMLTYFLTKSLQGSLFVKCCDLLMWRKHVIPFIWDHPKPISVLVIWLRVGQTNKKSSPAWIQEDKESNPVWRQNETGHDTAWRQRKNKNKHKSLTHT